MLEINVVTEESFDEQTSTFIALKTMKVRLEHSLVTVSKWESIWEKAFVSKKEKTQEETLSYVRLMIQDDIPLEIFRILIKKHLEAIKKYISDPMSATKVPDSSQGSTQQETITSELVYYWMISLNVPVEFEHWHFNRLITLIRVINFKNQPKKKMTAAERRALNNRRRSRYKTRG